MNWARNNMIELNRIREVEKLKYELESRLCALGIVEYDPVSPDNLDDTKEINYYVILKMIICGAFFPNYFMGGKVDLGEAKRIVGGRDLRNTVQLKNMPRGEGILYSQQLTEIFKPCAKLIQVS